MNFNIDFLVIVILILTGISVAALVEDKDGNIKLAPKSGLIQTNQGLSVKLGKNISFGSEGELNVADATVTGGVSKIIAGEGISLSPSTGTGDVTVGVSNIINVRDLGFGFPPVSNSGLNSLLLGGANNGVSGDFSGIVGGGNNGVSGKLAGIVGGLSNIVSGAGSGIFGGSNNNVSGERSGIFGGDSNIVSGAGSGIFGGDSNIVSGAGSGIFGGDSNGVSGDYAGIFGGNANNVSGDYAGIVGGQLNIVSGNLAGIFGGSNNNVSGERSGIFGGENHIVSGIQSGIVGGDGNNISGDYAGIFGGNANNVSGDYAGIVGGQLNIVSGAGSGIFGGIGNGVSGDYAGIVGGQLNIVSGRYAGIVGGRSNVVSGENSGIFGGISNDVSEFYAGIVGGSDNNVSITRSVALGGQGLSTYTDYESCALVGEYNSDGVSETAVGSGSKLRFAVGGGTGGGDRTNAFSVDDKGNLYFGTESGVSIFKRQPGGSFAAKAFTIQHPEEEDKWLVHGCLEGPEAGVYYRGKDIAPTKVSLPSYAAKIAENFSVQLTPIGKARNIATGEVNDQGHFQVDGEGAFFWQVTGTRIAINPEPYKKDTIVKSMGPYTWHE